MSLPVWVTVFVSGLVGSWIGGVVAGMVVVPILFGAANTHQDLTNLWILLSLGSAVAQAAFTALILMALLPSMSGIRVGFGTALIATICGYMVSTILFVLLFHTAIHSNATAAGGAGVLPGLGLASLLVPIAGIAVTTWMITSLSGGAGADKSHLYPPSFYDEIRKQ
jgi:hypothetical protein